MQARLNPKHPLPDICDYHARANLWGVSPGCYPKGKAPVPPFHPHCWCVLRSRPDLDVAHARVQPGAAQSFLRGMPAAEAARVVGSRERLTRVLNGADPVAVSDEGVVARYRTRRAGGMAASQNAPMTAYEIAKSGGRHAGLIRRYAGDTDYALKKGIKSLMDRIAEHEQKLRDPLAFVEPGTPDDEVRYLVNGKWPKEVAGFRDELSVMEGILKERTDG